MKLSKSLNMFNLQTLLVLSLVLVALLVQPAFGGNSDSGQDSGSSGSGSASVEDGTSTNSGEKGSCKLSGESKSGSGEACMRQNKTSCMIACSKSSAEEEGCDPGDLPEDITTTLAPTTLGAETTTANSSSDGECPCKYIEALENCTESEDFSDDQKIEVVKLQEECHQELVSKKCKRNGWGKWKEHRCKVKKVLKKIRKCGRDRPDVKDILEFKEIGEYSGNFLDFEYAAKTVCAQDSSKQIKGNCSACSSLDKLADNHPDPQFKADCKLVVIQLRIVFSYTEWDNSQRKGWAWGHIKRLMKKYPQYKQEIEDCEFDDDSGADLGSFGEGCEIYERIQSMIDILSGNVEECPLLQAMRGYFLNVTAGSVNERSLMKQLHDKLANFFTININIKMRLRYFSFQSYQFLLIAPGMKKPFLKLKIIGKDGEVWGTCYDISFSESFCTNFGCGNSTGGPGKFPAMSYRKQLITPDSSGKTYFMSAVDKCYTEMSTADPDRYSLKTAKNSLAACITSFSATAPLCNDGMGSECRINCINNFIMKMGKTLRAKLVVYKIDTWYGEKTANANSTATIGNFCGCS